MTTPDPRLRFSDRVANYVRYRPEYPDELLHCLRHDFGLSAETTVADVGSGTGISSAFLLRSGCSVIGVEPNEEMRSAAEEQLACQARFRSVAGSAEATTLPDRSVDLVAAGQAFHWFDRDAARMEFARILQPGGVAVLFWNSRSAAGTPLLRGYEQLLQRYGTDYAEVNHRRIDAESLRSFFGGPVSSRVFANAQTLDFTGLRGRLLSSSYTPGEGHPDRAPMLRTLRSIFDEHQRDGTVRIAYDTELYIGSVGTP
ncbi:class I SAM-dependent methyltransferase [soil metagenome]